MTPRRRWLVGGVVGAAIVAAGAGWVAGTQIKSPAQVAAETAPPEASLIAVPVERRTLTTEVIVRGVVRHGTPQPLAVATSPLKPDSPVVTSLPERGVTIDEGSLALAISGRPVLAFEGAQPSYRDLSVGTSGQDVRQLEDALSRMQLLTGPADDVFDSATAGAMAALYQRAGWAAFGLTPTQQQDLRAAHEAAAAAEDRRLQAKLALETAGATPSDMHQATSELASARTTASAAAGELAGAIARRHAAGEAVAAAQAADVAARATQQHDDLVAAAEVTNKTNALAAAEQNLQTAELALAEGQATATPAELAALQAAVDQSAAAVAGAQAELAAAQAGLQSTAAAGAAAVQAAAAAVNQAHSDAALADADVTRATEALTSANAALASAQTLLGRAQRPVGTATLREALGVAAREATRTSSELTKIIQTTGFQVPADEVLFLPSLPVRVDDVTARPGDVYTPEAVTVSSFTLAIDSALSLTDATLVRVGLPVTIEEPDLGITVHGTVSEVADRPGTKGTDAQHVYLAVTPEEAPDQLVGASVKLTIAVKSTTDDALAVPVSALSVTAGGDTRVQVLDDAETRFVTVRPGLAANGLVEVTVIRGSLKATDQVIVGDRTGAATTTTGRGSAAP